MAYTLNQPDADTAQNVTQPLLLNNTNQANTSFGVNHRDFTETDGTTGYHTVITSYTQSDPVGSITYCNAYAKQVTANIGPLLFSRQPTNVLSTINPTPVSSMQSGTNGITVAAGSSTTVLDFTGVNTAIAKLYAIAGSGTSNYAEYFVTYYGGTLTASAVSSFTGSGSAAATVSGNVLALKNNSSGSVSLFWTLQFLRLQ